MRIGLKHAIIELVSCLHNNMRWAVVISEKTKDVSINKRNDNATRESFDRTEPTIALVCIV